MDSNDVFLLKLGHIRGSWTSTTYGETQSPKTANKAPTGTGKRQSRETHSHKKVQMNSNKRLRHRKSRQTHSGTSGRSSRDWCSRSHYQTKTQERPVAPRTGTRESSDTIAERSAKPQNTPLQAKVMPKKKDCGTLSQPFLRKHPV